MKKYCLMMLMMPVMVEADVCDQLFQKVGTTVNAYDTTQWLEIQPFTGFWCDLDLAFNLPSNQGDFAYFYNDFDLSYNPNPTMMRHKFTLDLNNALRSFEHGDRMSIFQVRSANSVEDRLLNMHLIKQVEEINDGMDTVEYWKLKVVWFKPTEKGFEKTVNFISLNFLGTNFITIEYNWQINDYQHIKVNGFQYDSPYLLPVIDQPVLNRMGYINANTQMVKGDVIPFLEVIPNL
jgi:hypothetical protein